MSSRPYSSSNAAISSAFSNQSFLAIISGAAGVVGNAMMSPGRAEDFMWLSTTSSG